MIFYESETKSEAIKKALQGSQWSEVEKKAFAEILKFVEVKEQNAAMMATDEWQNNPDFLPDPPQHICHGKWVDGQDTYAVAGQKFMLEDAGNGYRIGKCYPEPDKSRHETLAEVLENCYQAMTRGESQEYSAEDAKGVFYTISPQQMAQWDYTAEDWKNMDFDLLADEIMESLELDM